MYRPYYYKNTYERKTKKYINIHFSASTLARPYSRVALILYYFFKLYYCFFFFFYYDLHSMCRIHYIVWYVFVYNNIQVYYCLIILCAFATRARVQLPPRCLTSAVNNNDDPCTKHRINMRPRNRILHAAAIRPPVRPSGLPRLARRHRHGVLFSRYYINTNKWKTKNVHIIRFSFVLYIFFFSHHSNSRLLTFTIISPPSPSSCRRIEEKNICFFRRPAITGPPPARPPPPCSNYTLPPTTAHRVKTVEKYSPRHVSSSRHGRPTCISYWGRLRTLPTSRC